MTLAEMKAAGAGRMVQISAIAIVSLIVIALFASHQIGVVVTKINLLAIGAVGGYWIDRLASRPERRPHLLVGMDRSMAEVRRAIIIVASLLAMALGL